MAHGCKKMPAGLWRWKKYAKLKYKAKYCRAAREKGIVMADQPAFDPQAFLTKIGAGRTLTTCPNQHLIFTQGEPADAVFYIQDGQVKLTVVSAQGKEAVIALLEPEAFFWRGVSGRAAAAHGHGHGIHRLHADAG